jgi:membrane protein DedA with SNARE-associated domain
MIHWLQALLAHQGYWVVFLVVFLNNLCFPVPGDTTLLGSGFLVGKGDLSLWAVVAAGTAGCFLGGNGGYWLGRRFGPRFLKKIQWLRINPRRMEHVERFFEKYGAKAVFFARFVALLHPLTGLLAGMWKTPFRPFLFFNLAGGFAYALLYTMAGYFFGQRWEIFKSWLGPAALYAVVIAAALLVLGLFLRRSIRAFFIGASHQKNGRPGRGKKVLSRFSKARPRALPAIGKGPRGGREKAITMRAARR